MRYVRDPHRHLAELHDRLAQGWSLIGMEDEAETERNRARGLREPTPADTPAVSKPGGVEALALRPARRRR